jgi:hypothetical protein
MRGDDVGPAGEIDVERAGLEAGGVLVSVGGQKATSLKDPMARLSAAPTGEELKLVVQKVGLLWYWNGMSVRRMVRKVGYFGIARGRMGSSVTALPASRCGSA